MNAYATKPGDIPANDLYADVPLYGRYHPVPDDLCADPRHINSHSSESLQYWASVLDQFCNQDSMIYPADATGRDVFAVGSLIIKSSHLHAATDGAPAKIDYTYDDANEVEATALAGRVLKDTRVPEIYFSGKVRGRQVLVQERIPGVALNVALPYLSQDQKQSFKQQARAILRQLHTVQPEDHGRARNHVVPDPNILTNGRIQPREADILFSTLFSKDGPSLADADVSFMHNDFSDSNCIVHNGTIVGLIDWEMAGFIGWQTAREIHRKTRTPQPEHFAAANLSADKLEEIMWWVDLYDDGMPASISA